MNAGEITRCYSQGRIIVYGTNSYLGGLVGINAPWDISTFSGTIADSYSTMIIESPDSCFFHTTGGLVGDSSEGTIRNCHFAGRLLYNSDLNDCTGRIPAGLAGPSDDTQNNSIVESFWDIDKAGETASGSGTGLTTEQMSDPSNFPDWDFTNTWMMNGSFPYPILRIGVGAKRYPGDINGDGRVNLLDLAILSENWLAGVE